jgi:chaperonin GroES
VDFTKVEGGFVKMALNIKPLGDRVVVEPLEKEDTTPSGLVLPETAKEKPQEGTILAAGPGRVNDDGTRVAMDVKVGDRVLYAKYAGTEFKLNDKKYLILGEKDILAVIQ